jgi:hypothetical protein
MLRRVSRKLAPTGSASFSAPPATHIRTLNSSRSCLKVVETFRFAYRNLTTGVSGATMSASFVALIGVICLVAGGLFLVPVFLMQSGYAAERICGAGLVLFTLVFVGIGVWMLKRGQDVSEAERLCREWTAPHS